MMLTELAARFASEGLVAAGYTVMRGVLSDAPDKQIALFETGGSGPSLFLGGSTAVDQPALQVMVRGAAHDYDGPRLVVERLYQAMAGWGGFTASSVRYLGVTPLQAPFVLDRDASERVVFCFNALVQKEPSPTA